jgi:hypothetical protein
MGFLRDLDRIAFSMTRPVQIFGFGNAYGDAYEIHMVMSV